MSTVLKSVLTVENLSVTYRNRQGKTLDALRNLSFSFTAGEVIGVMGPSGSGKSTLALAVLDALPRTASFTGSIRYYGSTIAPVFQESLHALHPMLTAGRQIEEAARARGRRARDSCRAEAHSALERVGLDPARVSGAFPHQLSGGQRQRVLIAQAIVAGPELIVADEPTASLDSVAQAGIVKLLRELRERGSLSILLISHSEILLGALADRILRMRDGRFVDNLG